MQGGQMFSPLGNQIFLKNSFFGCWVEEGKIKSRNILKRLLGWCQDRKEDEKSAFYGMQNRGFWFPNIHGLSPLPLPLMLLAKLHLFLQDTHNGCPHILLSLGSYTTAVLFIVLFRRFFKIVNVNSEWWRMMMIVVIIIYCISKAWHVTVCF